MDSGPPAARGPGGGGRGVRRGGSLGPQAGNLKADSDSAWAPRPRDPIVSDRASNLKCGNGPVVAGCHLLAGCHTGSHGRRGGPGGQTRSPSRTLSYKRRLEQVE